METEEYYGGLYPSPPDSYWENDKEKPTQEEIEDYYSDIRYEEEMLREDNK